LLLRQALGEPGPAKLDPARVLEDGGIPRAAGELAARELAHLEWQHVARIAAGERLCDVALRLLRLRHRGEPQPPQLAIRRRRDQRIAMLARERLEAHAVAFERDGPGVFHV